MVSPTLFLFFFLQKLLLNVVLMCGAKECVQGSGETGGVGRASLRRGGGFTLKYPSYLSLSESGAWELRLESAAASRSSVGGAAGAGGGEHFQLPEYHTLRISSVG